MTVGVEEARSEKGMSSLITLTNRKGESVTLATLGAGIAAVNVSDRDGHVSNVVAQYVPNEGAEIWDYTIVADNEVEFSLNGQDIRFSYRWTEENVLEVYFPATGDYSVLGEILRQTYFNLDVDPYRLKDEYLWINSAEDPDFMTARQLRTQIKPGRAFSHCWQLRDWQPDVMNEGAVLASHLTGRQLTINTSFPSLKASILSSHTGISFATTPLLTPTAPQITFLQFINRGSKRGIFP